MVILFLIGTLLLMDYLTRGAITEKDIVTKLIYGTFLLFILKLPLVLFLIGVIISITLSELIGSLIYKHRKNKVIISK